jgi:hypothetical protein
MIISLEEETLTKIFGAEYENYKTNVPRLLPRLKPWKLQTSRISDLAESAAY